MSSSRSSIPARRRQIPGTRTLNWQKSGPQAARPLARRPATACDPCRAAKAKCNGQPICERCTHRGLVCTSKVANTSKSVDEDACGDASEGERVSSVMPPTSTPIDPPVVMPSPPHNEASSDFMLVDVAGEVLPTSREFQIDLDTQHHGDGMAWTEQAFNHALEQLDWVYPTLSQNGNLSQEPISEMPSTIPQLSETTNERLDTVSAQEQTLQPPSISTPFPFRICHCRATMMTHVPRLECTISQDGKPHIDRMFRVTDDIIRSCLESARCECLVGPVDLVCIMTVFVQTGVCFDCIAKSGFRGTLRVGIGNYCVSLTDDASLKRVLVMDLLKHADEFLNVMTGLADRMRAALRESGVKRLARSPNCLNQLNLDYVGEAVASFRKFFGLITDFFSEKNTQPGMSSPAQYMT